MKEGKKKKRKEERIGDVSFAQTVLKFAIKRKRERKRTQDFAKLGDLLRSKARESRRITFL